MLPHPDFPRTLPALGEALRVLLIEDDPIMVEIVGSYLRRNSFTQCELYSKATLTEGLAFLAQIETDLVISDLHLPDSAGEATINALVNAVGCPVIAITSDLHPALRDATLTCGAYDFLHKSRPVGSRAVAAGAPRGDAGANLPFAAQEREPAARDHEQRAAMREAARRRGPADRDEPGRAAHDRGRQHRAAARPMRLRHGGRRAPRGVSRPDPSAWRAASRARSSSR